MSKPLKQWLMTLKFLYVFNCALFWTLKIAYVSFQKWDNVKKQEKELEKWANA